MTGDDPQARVGAVGAFTVETFNGHDTALPKRAATFVALQERGPEWHALHTWYPAGLQEAMGWNGLRFKIMEQGRRFLHHDGKHYGHPNTTPERWALWIAGALDDQLLAVIDPHLINNAWGDPIRGERRLRRRLWRKGWGIVKQLRRELERHGYVVFIAGDLNRTLRWWHKLGEHVISHGFDHIFYPDQVELLESWTGDPNGSDHAPLFGRFRFKAPKS